MWLREEICSFKDCTLHKGVCVAIFGGREPSSSKKINQNNDVDRGLALFSCVVAAA